jgi:quinol monooxygenase YgiN
MAERFGMHGRFIAHAGDGEALAAILLEAAELLGDFDECLLYVISRSPDNPDAVWVTEAWADKDAHDASLADERVRRLIERAMPLMAAPPETTTLRPIGGKGPAT